MSGVADTYKGLFEGFYMTIGTVFLVYLLVCAIYAILGPK